MTDNPNIAMQKQHPLAPDVIIIPGPYKMLPGEHKPIPRLLAPIGLAQAMIASALREQVPHQCWEFIDGPYFKIVEYQTLTDLGPNKETKSVLTWQSLIMFNEAADYIPHIHMIGWNDDLPDSTIFDFEPLVQSVVESHIRFIKQCKVEGKLIWPQD